MFLLSLFELKTFKTINFLIDCWLAKSINRRIIEYHELDGTRGNCWVQLLTPQETGKVNEVGREIKAVIVSKENHCPPQGEFAVAIPFAVIKSEGK